MNDESLQNLQQLDEATDKDSLTIQLDRALSHLATIDAVHVSRFGEWAHLNPGGVGQLIRALIPRLPESERAAFRAALAAPINPVAVDSTVIGGAAAAGAGDAGAPATHVSLEGAVHYNPVQVVYFRAGIIACREYMARFVEAESPSIAASIRANWWPRLGQDFGPPRLIDFSELTEGEYGEPGFRAMEIGEVSPTLEALPVALDFLNAAARASTPEADR